MDPIQAFFAELEIKISHSAQMPPPLVELTARIRQHLEHHCELRKWIPFGSVHVGTGIEGASDWDFLAVLPKQQLTLLSNEPISALRRLEACLSDLCGREFVGHLDPPAFSVCHRGAPQYSLDVVPAFSRMDLGASDHTKWSAEVLAEMKEELDGEPYLFPGHPEAWLATQPGAQLRLLEVLDSRSSGMGRRIIRLLKKWTKLRGIPIRSYFLEVFVLRWFQNTHDLQGDWGDIEAALRQQPNERGPRSITTVSEGLCSIVEALNQSIGQCIDVGRPLSLSDPTTHAAWGETYATSTVYEAAFALSTIASDLGAMKEALGLELHGRTDDAIAIWKQLLASSGIGNTAASFETSTPNPSSELTENAKQEVVTLNDIGVDYANQGRFADAIIAFDKALAICPHCADSIYNKGAALLEMKKTDEAKLLFEEVTKVDAKYPDGYFGLGNCYLDLEQYREAVLFYDRAIKLADQRDRRNGDYWHNKGLALRRLEFLKDAESAFSRARQYE